MKNILLKSSSLIFSLVMLISAFSFSSPAYAEDVYAYGVDVSEHNEGVDFSVLKSQGYSYAIIRLGYYNHLDKKFYEHINKAVSAGMNYGVYLYSYAESAEEAQIEIQFVLSTLSGLTDEQKALMTYPVAYDIEDKKISAALDKNAITQNAVSFATAMAQSGYSSMIYANTNWFTNYIDAATLSAYGINLWCADYTQSPLTKGNMMIGSSGVYAYMWQFSSTGIDQNVTVISDASAGKIKLSYTSTTYNGKSKKPSVKAYNSSGQLIPSQYYTVSYSANKNPGKAKVTVKFKGLFSGQKTASFTIKPKKQTVKSLKSAKKKKMTLKWKKDSTVTGYQIQYSTSKKFTGKTTKTVTIKKKSTTQKTISNLKSKKKYFVRIRAYKQSNGKKIYGAWTKTKSVKVK